MFSTVSTHKKKKKSGFQQQSNNVFAALVAAQKLSGSFPLCLFARRFRSLVSANSEGGKTDVQCAAARATCELCLLAGDSRVVPYVAKKLA